MSVAILGAGALGRLTINILEAQERTIKGIYDDDLSESTTVQGYPILGTLNNALENTQNVQVVISIGDVATRQEIFTRFDQAGFEFTSAVHPSSIIADSAEIGRGVIIKESTVVEPDVKIGENSLIGNGSIICHDVRLGNHVRLAPSVTIAGHTNVGSGSYLAVGVNVDRDITVGSESIICSGCSIWKDVPENTIVKLPTDMKTHDK